MRSVVGRILDSWWLTRYGNLRSLLAFPALLAAGVALGVAAVVSFPLSAQILCAVGAGGSVLTLGPRAVRTVAGRRDIPLRDACQDLLTELATMRGRAERAYNEGTYFVNFSLPAQEFANHRKTLTRRKLDDLHAALREIYVAADAVNYFVQAHESLPAPIWKDERERIGALIARATAAEHELRQLLLTAR
jgi:hypothetical protein